MYGYIFNDSSTFDLYLPVSILHISVKLLILDSVTKLDLYHISKSTVIQQSLAYLILKSLTASQVVPNSNTDSGLDVSNGTDSTLNRRPGLFSFITQKMTVSPPN